MKAGTCRETPRRWLRAALLAGTAALVVVSPAAVGGTNAWGSWTFDDAVSTSYDGLSLKNVKFQGHSIINKLSFPVMRVFYEDNVCGPYADRLGGSLSVIPWADNAKLAKREFTLNGKQWYEVGIRDQIGSYDIYQVYYLSADGIIDAHIYSKGLQCVKNHIHYPNWRVDFDLDGATADQILRDAGSGFLVMNQEFNANATTAVNHAWRVRDSVTGLAVDVLPGFSDFAIPDNTTVPVSEYSNNTVFGRLYKSTENKGWTYGPNTQVPFNEGENINAKDIVLWYEGYLPHSALEGSGLWHSTGVRLVVNIAGSPPPPPPPPPGPEVTRSYSGGALSILDKQPASPYPAAIQVGDTGGLITRVTVSLNGLTHTYPDDLDVVLVGPGGQAVMLMSDAGGGGNISGVSLTFDPAASSALSSSSQVVAGSYTPVNYGTGDTFPAPGPGVTYGTSLAAFNGLAATGTWKLYVLDDVAADVGSMAGWTLNITTQ